MYYEFWLDIYLAENLLMDLGLLLLAGSFLKCRMHFGRILLSAIAGTGTACLPVWIPVFRLWPVRLTLGILSGTGMLWYAFRLKGKNLAKGSLLFWGSAFAVDGILNTLAFQTLLPLVLAGSGAAGLLKGGTLLFRKLKGKEDNFYQVTVKLKEREVVLTAYMDTGNQLREPFGGRPVSVGNVQNLQGLLDKTVPIFLIPYHSIGKADGLLPGFTADWMIIRGNGTEIRIRRAVVALSKEPVSRIGAYQMLLSPYLTGNA